LELARDPTNQQAREELYRIIETELRRIAHARLKEQPHVRSLCTTELIHEAWVRLLGNKAPHEEPRWANRRHFFAATSRVIQNLLVDHYRKLLDRPWQLDSALLQNLPDREGTSPPAEVQQAERFLALHEALERLDRHDPNAAEICRLRCFGNLLPGLFGQEPPARGMKLQEIADELRLPLSTVHSRWKRAAVRGDAAASDPGLDRAGIRGGAYRPAAGGKTRR